MKILNCDTDIIRAIRSGYQTCLRLPAGTDLTRLLPLPIQVGNIVGCTEPWDWQSCKDCPASDMDTCVACKDVLTVEPYGHGKFLYEATSNETRNWHKGIHMPIKAIRTRIRVTGIRLERLWNLTEIDAQKEGYADASNHVSHQTAKDHFRSDWDRHMAEKIQPEFMWSKNPHVYVLDFEYLDA